MRFDLSPRWFGRIAALAMLTTLLFAGACESQIPPMAGPQKPKYTDISYTTLASYYGVTFCTERGVYSYINTNLSAIDEADVKAHEAAHRQQYTRFPSCRAFQDWYETPKGRLDAESEAYAWGWCVSVPLGVDGLSLRQNYAERLVALFGGGIMRLDAITALSRHILAKCPEHVGSAH